MSNAALQASLERPKAVAALEPTEEVAQPKPKVAILDAIQARHKDAIERSGHCLHFTVVKALCRRCNQQCLLKNLDTWLDHPCPGQAPVAHAPAAGLPSVPATQPVTIGARRPHESHSLRFARGVWWCTCCGSYATATHHRKAAPKGLLQVCPGPGHATDCGKRALERIAQGKHPRDNIEWPE